MPYKKFVLRNLDQDLFEQVKQQMLQPAFRTKAVERMWKIEGMFAEAKSNHGLQRARYRSTSKVQIQAYMIALVQNLKRLVAVLWAMLASLYARWIGASANLLGRWIALAATASVKKSAQTA